MTNNKPFPHLTDDEIQTHLRDLATRCMTELTTIYSRPTGDSDVDDILCLDAMIHQINDILTDDDFGLAFYQLYTDLLSNLNDLLLAGNSFNIDNIRASTIFTNINIDQLLATFDN